MQLPRSVRAVLYDFDGTLIDSAESSFVCYVRTFEHFGIPFDRGLFERTYSPNWFHTYKAVGLPQERWDEANALWLTHYAEVGCELIQGAGDVMHRLHGHGIRQGLVTSGSRSRILRDVSALGLLHLLEAIICWEDVTRKKPHPEALMAALERLEVASVDAIYVGDSPEDVEMARAAGVFSVAIPGKYPNREALRSAGADWYVENLAAVAELVDGSKTLPL